MLFFVNFRKKSWFVRRPCSCCISAVVSIFNLFLLLSNVSGAPPALTLACLLFLVLSNIAGVPVSTGVPAGVGISAVDGVSAIADVSAVAVVLPY
jgi:hypothetical protein